MSPASRRAGACSLALLVSAAHADPVPVLALSVRDHGPSAERLAAVTAAVGADALGPDAMRAMLREHFGRHAPIDDVLRPHRDAIAAAENAYFAQRARSARRRLDEALAAMEAAPDALDLREADRTAYLRGLLVRARLAWDARRSDDVDATLRRALAFEPSWAPSDYDCPAPLRRVLAALRASSPPVPTGAGRIVVHAPRDGCTAFVDGTASASTARTVTVPVAGGTHRVALRCAEPSRVRSVAVSPGAEVSVSIDPRLDAALGLEGPPSLGYSATSEASVADADAAFVGTILGASRVVLVAADGAHVVEARTGTVLRDALAARIDAALGVAPPAPPPAPLAVAAVAPPRPAPRRAIAVGPWVLLGTGGALLVGGAVFLGLRGSALAQFHTLCADDGACPAAVADAARSPHDEAVTDGTVALALGVAGTLAAAAGTVFNAVAGPRPPAVAWVPTGIAGAPGVAVVAAF